MLISGADGELRAWAVHQDESKFELGLVDGDRAWDAPPAGWVTS